LIKTIADLLQELIAAESAKIDALGIKHGPTIGAMYEGLGRRFLGQTLPVGSELRIVHGFVRGLDGTLSRQTDCMVVMGEGEELPHGGGMCGQSPMF
jgi:hypothetical protein